MSESLNPIRILLVDDHDIVRRGLQAVLADEEGLQVVGEAANATAAVERATALKPDLVIMDIRMGGADDASGIDACRQIRDELPATHVIMFSSYGERDSVLASLLAGATGFLTKNVGHAQLIQAIRAASRGESLLDTSVAGELIERLRELTRQPAPQNGGLSQRETEVLMLVAQGYTNKQIAGELYLSPFTARNHVIRVLDKLGLSRRSEAAAHAIRMGIVRP